MKYDARLLDERVRRKAAAPVAVRQSDDFYLWARQQAAFIRDGRFDLVDREALAEEIDDVGRSEVRALRSSLSIIATHMLKWDFQPSKRSRSWRFSIEAQRILVVKELAESPSLKAKLDETLQDAYAHARVMAAKETRLPLSTFPELCPYPSTAALDRDFVLAPDDRD